jgi:hypothetical protein
MKRKASDELEAFMDESHRVCRKHGFGGPSRFERMREEHDTHSAMVMLVWGHIQSGLTWCRDKELLSYSIEGAVVRFKDEFDEATVKRAEERLQLMREVA